MWLMKIRPNSMIYTSPDIGICLSFCYSSGSVPVIVNLSGTRIIVAHGPGHIPVHFLHDQRKTMSLVLFLHGIFY